MGFVAETPDQMATVEQMRSMSGLAFMQAIMDGKIAGAPISKTLGYDLESVEPGRVVFAGTPAFESYNPIGSVHGGWYGTLLDSCMACAVQSLVPAGKAYTTLEYKVNILRAASMNSGRLRAIGDAVHVGRRTGVAEGRIVDENGKIFATGTTTCLIFDV